jgi:hypothetical protein
VYKRQTPNPVVRFIRIQPKRGSEMLVLAEFYA